MFEDEKNEQQINNTNQDRSATTNPYSGYSGGNFSGQSSHDSNDGNSSQSVYSKNDSQSSYTNSSSQSSFGSNSSQSNFGSNNSQSAYGNNSSQNSYGSNSSQNSYNSSQNTQSSYGGQTGYGYGYGGQSSYGSSGQGGYSYSYGQNSYSYNPNAQTGYGTYQYNTSNIGGQPPQNPPTKKKNVFVRVVAAICALSLVAGGGYFAYSAARSSGLFAKDIQDEETSQPDTSNETQEDNGRESASSDKEIQTTTVTGETKAVVTDVTAVVEEVMPAMVIIHNNYTASASYFGFVQQEEATASGSGIIVGENESELLIATNYHVVEGADSLEVIFTDDSTVEAVVKGTDSDMDLAVIAVMLDDISSSTRDTIKIATLGDSNSLKLGEPAIAIGNALGYGQSVTTGVISAINREVEISTGNTQTFIQTDAAINPGNSGGALLNLQGEVIGINSNKIGGDTIEGMGYAIPISVAQPIIDKLMNEKTRLKVSSNERGYIGISGVSVTSEVSAGYGIPRGVYVAEVSRGGGAEAAGLAKGDVITEFDGQEITSMDDLQTRLQYYAAGTEVTVKVMRQDGQEYVEKTYQVTLGHGAGASSGGDSNAGQQEDADGFSHPGTEEYHDHEHSEEGDH